MLHSTKDHALSNPRPDRGHGTGTQAAPRDASHGLTADPGAAQAPALLADAHSLLTWLDQTMAQLSFCRTLLASMISGTLPAAPSREAPVEIPPRKLTAVEAAERLQVTVETINGWCVAKRFPNAQALGRAGWRIPLSDIEALGVVSSRRGHMRGG
jgi:hypothetical protein